MHLLMAMKQRFPRMISPEVRFDNRLRRNHHHILIYTGCADSGDADQLEPVPVQMHGMSLVAPIIENQPVALALLYLDGIGLRPRLAVNRPFIHPAAPGKLFLDY